MSNCSHNYASYPRIILCQSEQLKAVVPCPDAEYLWSPGGFTVDTIQLNTGVAYTVDSNCPECEDSDSASYCMPVIRARCIEADSVACVSGSNVVTTKHSVESQHVCSGDSINWSSMEFDYTLTPVGITCAYGGTAGHVEFTIDCALVEPGTYYIPVRVAATSGIKSNWALARIKLTFGNCCN